MLLNAQEDQENNRLPGCTCDLALKPQQYWHERLAVGCQILTDSN